MSYKKKEEQIHEAVRSILKDLGIKIVEFEKNRSKTECCGCGGMVGVTNKELWLSQKKIKELILQNVKI